MPPKTKNVFKRGASKIKLGFEKAAAPLKCRNGTSESPLDTSGDTAAQQEKAKHFTLIERVNDVATTVNSRRKSIASTILHKRRQSTSLDINRPNPALPPELFGKIASFMTQHELLLFSKVSRDTYRAAERHLYRRPYTRRFDKLLRTLEKSPNKGELVLELAFGFETDFCSVEYSHSI